MRESHKDRYVSGDYWRECAVCGFDYLRSEMVFRWDGLLVCQADNDTRNPQDTPSYNHNHPPFRPDGQGQTPAAGTSWADLVSYSMIDAEYYTDTQIRLALLRGTAFSAPYTTGLKVRLTFSTDDTPEGNIETFTGVSIGRIDYATGAFLDTPTRVTFNGSNTIAITGGQAAVSDEISFTHNGQYSLGIHLNCSGIGYTKYASSSGARAFILTGGTEDCTMSTSIPAASPSPVWFTISKIEIGNP